MRYKNYNDYELIYMVRENDSTSKDLLYQKYFPIISSIAREFYTKYSNYGWEYEDFYQETIYAFEKCIVSYDDNKDTLFYTFLITCLRRSLITFSRNISNTRKNISNLALVDIDKCEIEDDNTNIDSIFEENRLEEVCKEFIYDPLLNCDDTAILELKMNGFTNVEISKLLGINYRGVQSKLRKIKKKLKNNVQNDYN